MWSPMVAGLGAMACLVFALAMVLLVYGRRKSDSEALSTHLQRTLERQASGVRMQPLPSNVLPEPQAATAAMPSAFGAKVQRWLHRLGMPAWGISTQTLWLLVAAGSLVFVLVGWKSSMWLAAMAALVFALGVVFFFWKRREKQRQRMLEQLPGFLDNMVRLIAIGTSVQASFQMAIPNAQEPLRGALQQASAMLTVSSNVGYAMERLEETWRLPEFGLLAAVFRMSTQYGGRADVVLERVATYIRDKHSAERELHAMSAEVRLSAWVLSLLPIVVGTLILVINDGYFMRMWNDDSGRRLIFLALGLELAGVLLLYRLAKLR